MGRHTRLSAAQPQARTTSLYGIICEGISFKRELMKRVDGRGFGLRKLLLILVASGCLCPYAIGQAQVQGQWATLPYTMPINPIHVSLLHNGKPGEGHARHIFHATINSGWEPLPAGSRSDPAHLAGLPPGV